MKNICMYYATSTQWILSDIVYSIMFTLISELFSNLVDSIHTSNH